MLKMTEPKPNPTLLTQQHERDMKTLSCSIDNEVETTVAVVCDERWWNNEGGVHLESGDLKKTKQTTLRA